MVLVHDSVAAHDSVINRRFTH